jgi:acylphosphatase
MIMSEQENQHVRLHAFIEGRVQGVGFRFFVITLADQYNITGWVRNNEEYVEVIAEGKRVNLEILLEYLKQGPRAAFVADVKYTWGPATGVFKGFSVKHGFDY